jgi:hypothetical protein
MAIATNWCMWSQSPFDLALETGNEPFVNYVFERYVFDTELILDPASTKRRTISIVVLVAGAGAT